MYQTNKLLEIKLLVDPNIVKETLSRIGIIDKKEKIIYQSCHLLKQFDTYYLVHFKLHMIIDLSVLVVIKQSPFIQ